MYSRDEIFEMLENLKQDICSSMTGEISYYLNMHAIFVQLLLHEADKLKVVLKAETAQVQNMKNIEEMNQFITTVFSSTLPTEFGKGNVISKLSSISTTQNLINDFENLKHEHEMLKQNNGILKNQNNMLVDENQNLKNTADSYAKDFNLLRNKISV